jgi:hypothetical protein
MSGAEGKRSRRGYVAVRLALGAAALLTSGFAIPNTIEAESVVSAAAKSNRLVQECYEPLPEAMLECPPCEVTHIEGIPWRSAIGWGAALAIVFFGIGWFVRVNKAALRTTVGDKMAERQAEATLHGNPLGANLLAEARTQVDTVLRKNIGPPG